MFSSAVNVGMRLNAWKMKPMRSRRSFVSFFSLERAEVDVADPHRTARERVEPGERVHERRLAGARRAHDRGEACGRELDGDVVERTDFGFAFAVDLGGVDGAGRDGVVAVGRGGRVHLAVLAGECEGHGGFSCLIGEPVSPGR